MGCVVMNDSRLDWVAELVSDARIEPDDAIQAMLTAEALREYRAFADEFSVYDGGINVVTVRLKLALRAAQMGDWRSASASLSLAGNEIQKVMKR